MSIKVLFLAGLLFLGACSGETLQSAVWQPGVPDMFSYGAGGRDLRVVIVGNPFPQVNETVHRAVTDAMQGNHHGPRTHFTTLPSVTARPAFRVVMMFNPARNMNSEALCGTVGNLNPGPREKRLEILTGFCYRDELQSEVWASILHPPSPDDESFRNVIANIMWELIPSQDKIVDDNNDCRRPTC